MVTTIETRAFTLRYISSLMYLLKLIQGLAKFSKSLQVRLKVMSLSQALKSAGITGLLHEIYFLLFVSVVQSTSQVYCA